MAGDAGRAPASRGAHGGRTAAVLVAIVAGSAVVLALAVLRRLPTPVAPLELPWPMWVVAFAVSEVLVVHVQIRGDSHSFSMTDLVFVAGLYWSAPGSLVAAQVTGVGLALLLHRRQPRPELISKLARCGLSGCLGATVFGVLGHSAFLAGPWDWVAALVAIAVSTSVGCLCLFGAMRVADQSVKWAELPRMLTLSLPFSLAVAAVGLLAGETAAQNPASLGLLALPSILLIIAYRAHAKAQEQQANLLVLHEVTSLLYESEDASSGLTDFLSTVRKAFRSGVAELVLFGDADSGSTLSRSREGERPFALLAHDEVDDVRRLVGWATGGGALTARTGLAKDAEIDRYALRVGLKDAMMSVLRTEDRVLGVLLVADRHGDVGRFAASDLALLETFARHVATSLDRGRLEHDLRRVEQLQEELRRAAMHDPLTGLPNRALFLDRTEHSLHLAGRNQLWPAVLYIDLDGFKPVNDTFGHQAGDVVLKVFAERLAGCLRSADTAARLGGDEFAVLLHGPIDSAGAQAALARIRGQLDLPIDLGGGQTAQVNASIGVCLATSDVDIDSLVRRADVAMYTAKRGGKGISVFYEPVLDDCHDARAAAGTP